MVPSTSQRRPSRVHLIRDPDKVRARAAILGLLNELESAEETVVDGMHRLDHSNAETALLETRICDALHIVWDAVDALSVTEIGAMQIHTALRAYHGCAVFVLACLCLSTNRAILCKVFCCLQITPFPTQM